MPEQTPKLQPGPIRILPTPANWPYHMTRDVPVGCTAQTLPIEPPVCPICEEKETAK